MNWPVAGWAAQTEPNPEHWPSRMRRTEVFTQAANGWPGEPQTNLGYKWTLRRTPVDNNWIAICWSPDKRLFCAVANSGTGNRVMTSPTGEVWATSPASSDATWTAVCWSRELGVFCAVSEDVPALVMTSRDGKSWSQTASITNAYFLSICWSPTLRLFCAVGVDNATSKGAIYTSPDAVSWTSRTYPWAAEAGDQGLSSVCWSPYLNLFAAVGISSLSGNTIATSSDGVTWTGRTSFTGNGFKNKVIWLDGPNIFLSYNTLSQSCSTSSNGTTWSASFLPVGSANSMAWCQSLGRLVGVFSVGTSRSRVGKSPFLLELVTWSQTEYATIRGTGQLWRDVCYAPELGRFVAVSTSGTGTRVATSP
jgi:hypothetical protein